MNAERQDGLPARLRAACEEVRRKSYPLADLIPLMQQAADALAAQPLPASELTRDQVDKIWDALTPAGVGRSRYDVARDLIAASQADAQPTEPPSEQAILHALTMARSDAHQQGDRALWLAFGRRMWLQIEAMRPVPTQTKGP